jgi:hypothetical protein
MKKRFSNFNSCSFLLGMLLLLVLASCEKQGMKACLEPEGDTLTRTLKFESFSGVEVDADVDVFVAQGLPQTIQVVGHSNLLDELKTEVSGGAFRVIAERCFSEDGKRPRVYVTIPEISRLDVSGTGNIYTDKLICDILEVKLGGAGQLIVNAESNKTITTLNGSGVISLNGSSNSHWVNLGGSGKIYSFLLPSNDVNVDLSGYGTVEVNAVKKLHAEISGSGEVRYKGQPEVESQISGLGKLIPVD